MPQNCLQTASRTAKFTNYFIFIIHIWSNMHKRTVSFLPITQMHSENVFLLYKKRKLFGEIQ